MTETEYGREKGDNSRIVEFEMWVLQEGTVILERSGEVGRESSIENGQQSQVL